VTWVKICGITSVDALGAAQDGGADAVGFVIAPNSPRTLDITIAASLIARTDLPTFLVSVDLTPSGAKAAMLATGADGVQPHGDHAHDVVKLAVEEDWRALFPIPVGDGGFRSEPAAVPSEVLPLFDTASSRIHGGTGASFDWTILEGVTRPFVLAGGLGVDNVADAITSVRPFGVDASSRLEVSPGVKDPDTIRMFIQEAKSA
jgi:phosphoribosylanthranilate isomerase